MASSIRFFYENVNYSLSSASQSRKLLRSIFVFFHQSYGSINFIFTTDKDLLQLNIRYLNHNYFTDVITFDHSENGVIEGDIFISIDRVLANSKKENVTFENELHRVMVHGLLHLFGLDDSTKAQKIAMRDQESMFLSLDFT